MSYVASMHTTREVSMRDDITGLWKARPKPDCFWCRGKGGYVDGDGPTACDCEHPVDAEARDAVENEAFEVLFAGYQAQNFAMACSMASVEAARQLEEGELDDRIEERVEHIERERAERARQLKLAKAQAMDPIRQIALAAKAVAS